jgi:outer membrane protein TolC
MMAQAVKAAEKELEREYLQVFPNITAGFNLERTERRAMPGRKILADTARASVANGQLTAPDIETRGQRRLARRQIIDATLGPSIEVTLPVWDQNQAQIAKARFKAVQARRRYEDLLDAVAEQVQRASASACDNAKLVQFYQQELLPQVNQNVEGARRIYKLGEQSIIVLIEAQRSLVEQRAAYVSIMRDYALAVADLEQALGGRIPPGATTQPASSQPTP